MDASSDAVIQHQADSSKPLESIAHLQLPTEQEKDILLIFKKPSFQNVPAKKLKSYSLIPSLNPKAVINTKNN